MKVKILLTLLLITLTNLSAQVVDKNQMEENRWSHFPVNSWIILKSVKSNGQQEHVYTEKRVKAGEKDAIALDVYWGKYGVFPERKDHTIYHEAGLFPSKSKQFKKPVIEKTTLLIDGKNYECTIETYTLTEQAAARGNRKTIKLWKCSTVDIPYRILPVRGKSIALGNNVLKIQYKAKFSTKEEETMLEVVKLRVKKTLKEKEFFCVEEVFKTKQIFKETVKKRVSTVTGTARRWITRDIPGNFYKSEITTIVTSNGQTSKLKTLKAVSDFSIPNTP